MLSVLAAGFAGLYLVGLHWNLWAVDFSALYFAGHFFSAGDFAQIYAAPEAVIGSRMPPSWVAAVAAAGHPGAQTYAFIYPPWVAAVAAGLVWFDPQAAMNMALVVNVTLVLGSIHLARRIIAPQMARGVWMLVSLVLLVPGVPLMSALLLGQVQILVFSLCVLAFERYVAGAFVAAGVALALAACLKITPAALALIFLFDRNGRAFLAFFATGAGMLAVSFAVAGGELHQTYLGHLRTISDHIYSSFFAFSFETFLHEVWDAARGTALPHVANEYIFPKPAWISATSTLCLLGAIAVLWRVTRRIVAPRRTGLHVLGLALIVPIFAPLGWAHYYLLALYVMPGVLVLMPRRGAIALLVILCVTLSVPFQSLFFDLALPVYPQILIMVPIFIGVLFALLVAATAWKSG